MRTWMLMCALLLGACGSGPVEPDEDVPARWTAGDDEPLDAAEE